MKVCIVGNGLVSIALAKALVNKGIYVDLFSGQKINKIDKSRTIGISKTNIDFFNKNILNISKFLWEIKKIEVFSDNLKNEKLLNFKTDSKNLFSIFKNADLYNYLFVNLKKSIFFKLLGNKSLLSLKKYNLIINCDSNSKISKKYFFKKILKNYHSYAFTTIINHKKLLNNNTAVQIFTKKGPIAFLPISENKTSVVYSVRNSKKIDLENLIKKYNPKYEIMRIDPVSSSELKSINLRKYYFENILAFGDMLHTLHPHAGQGFNMTIRDIKSLLELIDFKIDHGLQFDSSICSEFEKKTRHKNYLFSGGIDFVYEYFNFESKLNSSILSKTVQFLGRNKNANRFFTKLADNGLI